MELFLEARKQSYTFYKQHVQTLSIQNFRFPHLTNRTLSALVIPQLQLLNYAGKSQEIN